MHDPVTDDLVIVPADEELKGLQELVGAFDTAGSVFVRCDDRESVELSHSARQGLERLVSYLAADVAVAMKPYDETLTTREAADLLGMSRPYLVHLLETEAIRIPVQKVGPGAGGHRRIMLRDVLAYRAARDAENDMHIDRFIDDRSAEDAGASHNVEWSIGDHDPESKTTRADSSGAL